MQNFLSEDPEYKQFSGSWKKMGEKGQYLFANYPTVLSLNEKGELIALSSGGVRKSGKSINCFTSGLFVFYISMLLLKGENTFFFL